uniref:PC-esterase domain-containing protein 1A-like n=1 Tax=Euleptes europaea TaxID=460621 RepID=UPI0025412650|nr:PC-esterase domain-containing protein 1A-like [Euleptes europaea]
MLNFHSKEVRQLLHNKFVVILGDSIQRSVYKDLIQLLQSDSLLSSSQMKSKGELRFENDHLIEGGVLGELHNGTQYREVRQYRTDHHLIRFYFLTRIYSEYLESILEDFRAGPQPDVLVLNSCVWDLSRYGTSSMEEYCGNLQTVFNRLDAVLPAFCLVIWNMTMPLGPRVTGGFLIPELRHLSQSLRNDIIEGNFYGATLASLHLFDVVDLHFHFRHDLSNRVKDGVHWNNVVHRRITNLLLAHVADAWGVEIPDTKSREGPSCNELSLSSDRLPTSMPPPPPPMPLARLHQPAFHEDFLFRPNTWGTCETYSGATCFEDSQVPPFHLDAAKLNTFQDLGGAVAAFPDPSLLQPYPSCNKENILLRSHHRKRKTRGIENRQGLIMRSKPFWQKDVTPYERAQPRMYRDAPFQRAHHDYY